MSVVVLDACALIAYLRGETGCERVEEILAQTDDPVLIHAVNLGEVFYDGLRRGDEKVKDLWEDTSELGIEIRRDLDDAFVTTAAKWKARHRIAYADAFALALAQKESAVLATTDHNELDAVSAEGQVQFLWLR